MMTNNDDLAANLGALRPFHSIAVSKDITVLFFGNDDHDVKSFILKNALFPGRNRPVQHAQACAEAAVGELAYNSALKVVWQFALVTNDHQFIDLREIPSDAASDPEAAEMAANLPVIEGARWLKPMSPYRLMPCAKPGCEHFTDAPWSVDASPYCLLDRHLDLRLKRKNAGKKGYATRVVRRMLVLFPGLDKNDAKKIFEHAWAEDSWRVGTARDILLDKRIYLAVRAWARHNLTEYDSIISGYDSSNAIIDAQREARADTYDDVETALEELRSPALAGMPG